MQHGRWSPLTLICHPSKFGSHRYGESVDIRYFICHTTLGSKGDVTWWVEAPTLVTAISSLLALDLMVKKI